MLDRKQRERFLRDNRARLGIGIVIVMALAVARKQILFWDNAALKRT